MLRKEALKGESEDKSHVLLKESEVSSKTRRDAEPRKWEISFSLCHNLTKFGLTLKAFPFGT